MPVSGVNGVMTTMRQLNLQAAREGQAVVKEAMDETKAAFGTTYLGGETKIGTGELNRTNNEIENLGIRDIEKIMQQDDKYESSNLGNAPAIRPSGILNDYAPK